ncbi:MAG: IS481 family transposase [Candidatus Marinimicrobia bacterium]|nr:IS481 family transposase [Candidatus Neomarinimicrobiota bacterium]MBT5269273.1 IS481 family transposase [Candidatus Neomarinimicrobiota bacterium]MBT7091443.1 IS481 family transposase [Candidatus Neomarinimicrobiota bacterium]
MTKIILAHELLGEGVPKSHIAKHLGVSRRTIIRWAKAIEYHGSIDAFLEHYIQAKKGPRKKRKKDAILKRRVWALREKHHQCCGQKIQYFLKKEYDQDLSVTTIYEILSEKYQLRSKWQKNKLRGAVPTASAAREVIQMDTVLFGDVFAFTAVDIYSKESDVLLRPALKALDGKAFLDHCMPRSFGGFAETIQTDGGSEFEAEFAETVRAYCAHHRVARPYKKNEQSYIESFNRSLRKECLGWQKYNADEIPELTIYLDEWLRYYHYERPHISLGMKPPLEKQV